jgi:hypothetical protein
MYISIQFRSDEKTPKEQTHLNLTFKLII